MSNPNRRGLNRRQLLAALGIGASGLAGCGGNGDGDGDGGGDDSDGSDGDGDGSDGGDGGGGGDGGDGGDMRTMRAALNSDPTTLDVHASTRYPEHVVLGAMHEPLFYLNKDVDPQPHLVSEYDLNEDATEFVFQLEKGITFHDGTELDAETAVWNLERVIDLEANASTLGPVDTMEATGDYGMTITTEKPFPLLLRGLSQPWMGMVSREAAEEAGESFGRDVVVGSGPYEFAEWESASYVRLERAEDYERAPEFAAQAQSNADEVYVEIIPEAATLANELMTGDIHGSHDLALGQTAQVEDNDATAVERNQGTWTFLPINTQKAPTDDVRVRRAIAHAVNKEPLIDVGLNGEGALHYGYVVPFWGNALSTERNRELAPLYDPEAAREELEAAGWTNDQQGETRTRDGEELVLQHFSFPLGLLENQAEAIQAMLGEVGIQSELNVPEASQFYNDLENNDHHIANSGGSFTPFASAVLEEYYDSSQVIIEGGRNYSNYANDDVDDLIATTRTDPDLDVRSEAAIEAQETLHEDVPAVPLNLLNRNYGHKTSLSGIDDFVDHPLWYSQYHLHWRELDV